MPSSRRHYLAGVLLESAFAEIIRKSTESTMNLQVGPTSFPNATPWSILPYWYLAPVMILGLMLTDDLLTYSNIRTLASRYGLSLAAALETNSIVRNSWLRNGMRMGELKALTYFIPATFFILAMATGLWLYFPAGYGVLVGIYVFIDARHINMHRNIAQYHPCPSCRTIHRTSLFLHAEETKKQ